MDLFYPKPFRIEVLVSIVQERLKGNSENSSRRSSRRNSDSSDDSSAR